MSEEMKELSPMQVRVLGCLIEKKETTPDQYPLTLNALRNACNQKTARNPVVAYSEGEVGHTLRELESMGLVREAWGARVPKYEHLTGKVLGINSPGIACLGPLMLRGPQTLGELKTNSHRLHEFDDLDDLRFALQRLADHDPSLISKLPRQPGQKEERYAHLLSGEPELPATPAFVPTAANPGSADRLQQLEQEVDELRSRIERLEEILNE